MKLINKIASFITVLYSKFMFLPNDINNKVMFDNNYKAVKDRLINRKIMVKTKDKSTMTEDMDCINDSNCDSDNNNNNKTNGNQSYTYYTNTYDHRIFNIYKLDDSRHKTSFLRETNFFGRKNLLIIFTTLSITSALFFVGKDLLSCFAFDKVLGYLFNNYLVIVKSEVPV